jgi:hypothetical protein
MKKIAFVMAIAVAVAWNFPTALIAGASEHIGAVDVFDTAETTETTTEYAVLTTESEENKEIFSISTSTGVSVPMETTTECVVTTSNAEFEEDTKYTDSLTEQQKQLSELKAKGDRLFGEFPRKEKEILGEIEQDSARVAMEDVSDLLSSENDFQQVYHGMLAIAGYPDFIGGSGVTNIEFWLDETGMEKILLILEQEDIIYVKGTEQGNISNCELVYPAEEEFDYDLSDTILMSSYRVYNDVSEEEIVTMTTGTSQTTESTHTTTVTTVESAEEGDLTVQQEDDLKELAQKEKVLFGEFSRARAVIMKELSADAPYLTLDEVKNAISDSDSYQELCQKLSSMQTYPDFIGGSGVTLTEYWLDENGNKKILLILEQEEAYYVDCSEDGTVVNSELLYSEKQGSSSIVDEVLLVGSYKIYNDIAELPITTDTTTSETTTKTNATTTTTTNIVTTNETENTASTETNAITTETTPTTATTTGETTLPQTGYSKWYHVAAALAACMTGIGGAMVVGSGVMKKKRG